MSMEESKSSSSVLRFIPTMAGEALGKEAGETVVSIAVPAFIRVQHEYKAICNLCYIQQGVHVSCQSKEIIREASAWDNIVLTTKAYNTVQTKTRL